MITVEVKLFNTLTGEHVGTILKDVQSEDTAQHEIETMMKACYTGVSAEWTIID